MHERPFKFWEVAIRNIAEEKKGKKDDWDR